MFLQEDYEKIFLDFNFREINAIKKDIKNGYYISHGTIKNKEVVIRILTKSDITRVKNYKKELMISKILEKGSPKNLFSHFACTREIGENEKFVWSIRDYVSGDVTSLYNPNEMLMGYDTLDPGLILSRDSILSGVKENLKFLWSINDIHDQGFHERFCKNMDPKAISFIESESGLSISTQIDFYEKNKKNVFSPENIRASFGDLIPANIIYKDSVIFLDFEWFAFDHYLSDVSFLWLYLWRYPDWQKELLRSIIITDQDQISFCLNLIRQIIGFYSKYIFNESEESSKRAVEKRAFFVNHRWTQYLKSADNYKKLMEIK